MSKGLARTAIICATLVALGVTAEPASAAAPETTFTIAPDDDAYLVSQVAALEADVRKAVADAAVARAIEFHAGFQTDDLGGTDNFAVYLRDTPRTAGVLNAVRAYFRGQPDVSLAITPAEILRISFPPSVLTKAYADPKLLIGLNQDARSIEWFVRNARSTIDGVRIDLDVGVILVSLDNHTRNAEIAAFIRRLYPVGGPLAASGPDTQLRITNHLQDFTGVHTADRQGNVGGYNPFSPARRLWWAPAIQIGLLENLRDPLDIQTEQSPQGVQVAIPNPANYPIFIDKLTRAFADRRDFTFEAAPAFLLKVGAAPEPDSARSQRREAPHPSPLAIERAIAVIHGLADPSPAEIALSPVNTGISVRAKDDSQATDVAGIMRGAFISRPDVRLTAMSDQSLNIAIDERALAARRPNAEGLAESVRYCLVALKLVARRVSVEEGGRVSVVLAGAADIAAVRRFRDNQCGFTMRAVDGDGDPFRTIPTTQPHPGDERLPQMNGPPLWLKPGAIITADMVAEAHAGSDEENHPDIEFTLTDEGRRRFTAFTTAYVLKKSAFVSNGVVLSAPTIASPITGERGQIVGDFSLESAKALATSIRTAPPWYPIKVVGAQAEK